VVCRWHIWDPTASITPEMWCPMIAASGMWTRVASAKDLLN
jgi:hypothetical protein